MDRIDCPVCEKYVDLDGDYESEYFDVVCTHCGEEFEVHVECEPSFSSSKIVYEVCIECGKKFRFNGTSFPRPEKHRHMSLDEYKMCTPCYESLIREDMKNWRYVNDCAVQE